MYEYCLKWINSLFLKRVLDYVGVVRGGEMSWLQILDSVSAMSFGYGNVPSFNSHHYLQLISCERNKKALAVKWSVREQCYWKGICLLTRFTNTYYTFKYVARAAIRKTVTARQWSAVRHQNAIQILEQSGSRIKIYSVGHLLKLLRFLCTQEMKWMNRLDAVSSSNHLFYFRKHSTDFE